MLLFKPHLRFVEWRKGVDFVLVLPSFLFSCSIFQNIKEDRLGHHAVAIEIVLFML